MLGNNGTFFRGYGGSRNDLHGIFSWMNFQPRSYYHETYSFYHDFLPCNFQVLERWMYAFSGFFDHAERSHVSFLPFWVFFLYMGDIMLLHRGLFFTLDVLHVNPCKKTRVLKNLLTTSFEGFLIFHFFSFFLIYFFHFFTMLSQTTFYHAT